MAKKGGLNNTEERTVQRMPKKGGLNNGGKNDSSKNGERSRTRMSAKSQRILVSIRDTSPSILQEKVSLVVFTHTDNVLISIIDTRFTSIPEPYDPSDGYRLRAQSGHNQT